MLMSIGEPRPSKVFGHGWLVIDAGKMSKYKGEFLTVSLLEEKGYDPLCYRFFCLQSHYRKSLIFSWEGLDNAAVAYQKLVSRIAALSTEGEPDEAAAQPLRDAFRAAMDNDLNTSLAITALYDVLKANISDATKRALIAEPAGGDDAEIEALVAARTEARAAKDWAKADQIRDELKARHIVVEDTPQGVKWHHE